MSNTNIDYPKLCLKALAALLCSLALAYATILILPLFLTGRLNSNYKDFDEIFARVFLLVALASLTFIAIRSGALHTIFKFGRWAKFLILAVGLGMVSAILDPFNFINEEYNVIRYWTAALLLWAALALFFASRTSHLSTLQKTAVVCLAILVMLGAADEIFQFHEFLGANVVTDTPDALRVSSGDFTTLFVALVGFIGAVISFSAINVLEQFFGLRLTRNIRTAVMLFIAACMVFLVAMILDTYDHYIERIANKVLAVLLGADSAIMEFVVQNQFIIKLSNCVEEFLELTTAAILVCCGMVLLQDEPPTRRSA